jgi:hypothetical protein
MTRDLEREILALLEQVEWCPVCPICSNSEIVGHAKGCELAAKLETLREVVNDQG